MNLKNYSFLFASITLLCFSQTGMAQLTTDTSLTPTQLVRNVLLGNGIGATGITYTGAAVARGRFYGYASSIGLDSGVILSSGDIVNAIGPNDNTGATADNRLWGDPDLDSLMAPSYSDDASVLEFDFIPTSDTVKFRYVFGSEEYMEFVDTIGGTGYNDGFGFFISGPGISGPYSRGAENIAIIPGTSLPVTMFNLNLYRHSAFYVDNGDGVPGVTSFPPGMAPDGATIQYDGYTVPLTAMAVVECGQRYHIKLAVADGFRISPDRVLDSGVFLEAGSFQSFGTLLITPTTSLGGNITDNDSTLYEGCGAATLLFDRGTINLAVADTFFFTLSGTATNGLDYTVPGDSVYFAAGQDSAYLTINSLADLLTEGTETVTVEFSRLTPCGTYDTVSATLYIADSPPIKLNLNNDTTISCPFHNLPLTATATGGVAIGSYKYTWLGHTETTDTIQVSPTVTTTYYATVTDTCGNTAGDSVKITVVPYTPMQITFNNDTTICSGDRVLLDANVTNGRLDYVYSWSPSLTSSDSISVYPVTSTGYTITATDACGYSISDSSTITVMPVNADFSYIFPTNQTSQFNNESSGAATYLWDFGDGSPDSSSTEMNPSHFYPNDGTYTITLISTSSIGCIDTVSKTVLVSPDFYFYYPNAFSPDGNGINDIYKGYGAGIKSYRMRIFNRWGEKLFETTDINTGWNGTTGKGSRVVYETYVVMFDLEGYHDEVKRFIGNILLVH